MVTECVAREELSFVLAVELPSKMMPKRDAGAVPVLGISMGLLNN
jgi:hypothetical protein